MLGVLVFHAGIERVVGGFLGVDLFFVLSGFLITTLLLREWHRTGGIALGGFYARRVRRLFPALLLVLLAVSVYMRVVAPAATRSAVRLDAVSSLFYVANWRFVFSHQSYFAGSLEPSPLRHLWSLAVEEQWYLVWPLVLTVAAAAPVAAPRRAARVRPRAGGRLARVDGPPGPGPRRLVARLLRHRLARLRAAARCRAGHLAPPAPGPTRLGGAPGPGARHRGPRRHRLVLRGRRRHRALALPRRLRALRRGGPARRRRGHGPRADPVQAAARTGPAGVDRAHLLRALPVALADRRVAEPRSASTSLPMPSRRSGWPSPSP